VSEIADFSELFSEDRNPAAATFNADLDKWDTSNAVTMAHMFFGADLFNGNVSTWNTSRVTSMREMFYRARSFEGDVSSFDTSRVTDMFKMVCDSRSELVKTLHVHQPSFRILPFCLVCLFYLKVSKCIFVQLGNW